MYASVVKGCGLISFVLLIVAYNNRIMKLMDIQIYIVNIIGLPGMLVGGKH